MVVKWLKALKYRLRHSPFTNGFSSLLMSEVFCSVGEKTFQDIHEGIKKGLPGFSLLIYRIPKMPTAW